MKAEEESKIDDLHKIQEINRELYCELKLEKTLNLPSNQHPSNIPSNQLIKKLRISSLKGKIHSPRKYILVLVLQTSN